MTDEIKNISGFALEGQEGLASWLRELGGESAAVEVLSMCLAMAARRGDAAVARRLLAEGADPQLGHQPASHKDKARVADCNGEQAWTTPWSAAVAADSLECLEAMVEAGLNPVSPRVMHDCWNDEDLCLARFAANKGAARCLARAMEWAREREPWRVKKITEDVWRELASGGECWEKVEEMARALCLGGGDIEEKLENCSGKTPLELAAGTSPSATKGLLAAGADPRQGNPVQCAVNNTYVGTQECLDALLAAGADPDNSTGPYGVQFPIVTAIETRQEGKVAALIGAGANVARKVDQESQLRSGLVQESLLARAARYSSARCVGVLLAAGLDPDEKIDGMALATWLEAQPWRRASALMIAEIRAASEAKALAAAAKAPLKRRASAPRI